MAAFPFRSNSGAHGGSILCFWQSEKLSGAHENSLQPMPGSVSRLFGGLLLGCLLLARFLVDLWMAMACRKHHARLLYSRLGKRSSRRLTVVARACITRHSHSRWTWKLARVPKRDDDLAAKPCSSESDEHSNPSALRQVDCITRGELTAPPGSVCLWVGGCRRVGWAVRYFSVRSGYHDGTWANPARLLYCRLGKRTARHLTLVARACIACHFHFQLTLRLPPNPERDDDRAIHVPSKMGRESCSLMAARSGL